MDQHNFDCFIIYNVHATFFCKSVLGKHKVYTLFINGRQPGTSARPNMESRRFRIKICFRANFDQVTQVTGQLTLKLSVI